MTTIYRAVEESTDVLVLVALKDELDAMLDIHAHAVSGTAWVKAGATDAPYWFRDFYHASGESFRITIARTTEMREPAIAALAATLSERLAPRCLAMCGVCAAPRADVSLGDVVVADQVFRYDMGKLITARNPDGSTSQALLNELKAYNLRDSWKRAAQDAEGTPSWHSDIGLARPLSFRIQEHEALSAIAAHMAGAQHPLELEHVRTACPDWGDVILRLQKKREVSSARLALTKKGQRTLAVARQQLVGGPKPDTPMRIHVGGIATVTNVIQDLDDGGRARIFQTIRRHHNRNIRAIEMEATAVGFVAQTRELPCIVAKGVQDHADEGKDDRYRPFAARASARFLIEFFHQDPTFLGDSRPKRASGCKVETSVPHISLSRLPTTRPVFLGRSADLAKLDRCWVTPNIHIATIIAPGGMGKTALVNRWLDNMGTYGYRGARRVLAWSFYTQGVTDAPVSGELFLLYLMQALGNPSEEIGDPWDAAERIAYRIRQERMLLIIDGLEPLQYPPGPNVGTLKDRTLLALLRELACSNSGLCVITSRLPVTDIEHFREHICSIDLEALPPSDGADLLQTYDILGSRTEFEAASVEFGGHPLALHLLGSYVRDVQDGDISKRSVVALLDEDEEAGGHATRVIRAYDNWFERDGPELQLLRFLGLFDRPVHAHILSALLGNEPIENVTTRLCLLNRAALKRLTAKLQRAKLVLAPDKNAPDILDVHPLIREYFQRQLRGQYPSAWAAANLVLFCFYRDHGKQQPDTIEEMESLFLSVIHGCRAAAHSIALETVYIPRIMRGEELYAAHTLRALNALLHVLSYFFDNYDWMRPVGSLTPEQKRYVLRESGRYLTEARGYADEDVGKCYIAALELSRDAADLDLQLEALLGLCRFSRVRGELAKSGAYAKDISELSIIESDGSLLPVVYRAHCTYLFYQGAFNRALDFAERGAAVNLARPQVLRNANLDVNDPGVSCLGYVCLTLWFLGYAEAANDRLTIALERARQLGHPHTQAVTFLIAAMLHHFQERPDETRRFAAALIAVCSAHGFLLWWIAGEILKAWADAHQDKRWDHAQEAISKRIVLWRRKGAKLFCPYWHGILATLLYNDGKYESAVIALDDGLRVAGETGEHWWTAELHMLRGKLARSEGNEVSAANAFEAALGFANAQHAGLLIRKATKLLGLSAAQSVDNSTA